VTVWEGFRPYFAERGLDVDYVLLSSYERLVDSLLAGVVDIAWNTNTAFVSTQARLEQPALLLGMRDVDAAYATVLVARSDDHVESPADLAGHVLAVGSRDSGHACILPIHHLREQGVPMDRVELLRFDTDLGKHGDTGDSERLVVEAVARGDARAGAVGDATWTHLRAEGGHDTAGLEVVWRSPTYNHCCFITALPTLEPGAGRPLAGAAPGHEPRRPRHAPRHGPGGRAAVDALATGPATRR